MFGRSFVVVGALCFIVSVGTCLRIRRQSDSEEGGRVIDNIFNIPITAIRQTSAAAQSFSPENSQTIDNVLQIPISTLEAVGNLVKSTAGQRSQNAEEYQRIRQERRDRLAAQRERQRQQREQLQQQRLKQQQIKRTIKFHNKDPFGLNALSNLLVGNHGLFGSYGGHGGHGGHMGLGGHGGHGGNGNHDVHGGHGNPANNGQHTYEVHENIEEDTAYTWHGITAGIGSYYGSRPTSTVTTIQNKIAPKDRKPITYNYENSMYNKVTSNTAANGLQYEEDGPIQNKIAPKSNRVTFRS
ncbi:uncharacterized protein LOC143352535 [Halictus rubicundus]|uniref:uncharacterized protein LOC143352535 n=1 Tax=Halictus rubicundus TaxID=77578 RepID=UPI004035762C